MDAGIFKKFLIRRKFNIIFGRTGGKNGDVEKSNKRNTDWKCMDRRKSSGSDQSMTNTKTEDVAATVEQILALEEAGCEIIRCAVPTMELRLR